MTVAWFDDLDVTIEVAFDTDPLDPTPTWTDITGYVKRWSYGRGRQSEFSAFSPGYASFDLRNTDRRFDPEYASSPYVGKLLPMKRIRATSTYDSVTYARFDGFVTGWPQTYSGVLDSTVTLRAVDGSRFLEQVTLADSAYHAAVLADSPMHYWPLQEQNASAASPYVDVVAGRELKQDERPDGFVVANPSFPSPFSVDQSVPVGAGFTVRSDGDLAKLKDSALLSTPPVATDESVFGIEGWFHVGSDAASCIMSLAARKNDPWYRTGMTLARFADGSIRVAYYNAVTGQYRAFDTTGISIGEGMHHLALWFDNDASDLLLLYVNGEDVWSEDITASSTFYGSSPEPGVSLIISSTVAGDQAASSFSHVAVYDYLSSYEDAAPFGRPNFRAHYLAGLTAYGHPYAERGGARIDRVLDEIGWPDALRDISIGDTVHGPYVPARLSAMQYLRDVETAEDGLVFLDAAGRLAFRDRNWQWVSSAYSVDFTDDGTGLDYSDVVVDSNTVDALRTAVSVSYGDSYLRVEDATNIAAYGKATESLSAPTLDRSETARGLATYKLRLMKDPRTRITGLVLAARDDPATMFPAALDIEVGSRVVVEIHPQSVGTPIVKSLMVQGMDHDMDSDVWTVRYYLAPTAESAEDAPYLTLGHATYGRIGASAGNKIPF